VEDIKRTVIKSTRPSHSGSMVECALDQVLKDSTRQYVLFLAPIKSAINMSQRAVSHTLRGEHIES